MVSIRHFVQCGIIFDILCTLVRMEFMIETLPSCGNQQLVEADAGSIPQIQSGLHSDIYNVTPRFNVGFVDKHVVGNISWGLSNGLNGAMIEDVTNIYVRLKLIVNEELEDVKYFTMKHSYHVHGNNTEMYKIMTLSCIHITSSPNASLKVDMLLLDRKSCDSDVIKENQTRQHSNILCHMFPISKDEFPISKMSCRMYNHYSRINNNLTPQIGIRARRISRNITIFDVYMTDINPYSSIHIWVFPSEDPASDLERYINYPEIPFDEPEDPFDDIDGHYDHIAFWETWTNLAGDVRLTKTEAGRDHSQFFVKVVTSCPQNDRVAFYTDDIDYDDDFVFISTSESVLSVKDRPEMSQEVPQRGDSLLILIRTSPEVMYGVGGGIVLTACIIAVLVWMKFHNSNFSSCSMHKDNLVLPGREETHKNLLDIESTASVLNNSRHQGTRGMNSDYHIPRTMLVHHANTTALQSKIKDLEMFLTRNGVRIEQHSTDLTENWHDFTERAGSSYRHVIFVLSSDLLTLLDTYRSLEPKESKLNGSYTENTAKWTKMMMDRNWNTIPCIVINKLRMLYNERQTLFRVHLIVFTDENLTDSGSLQNKFLSMFYSFLNYENTVCYRFKSSDLTEMSIPNSDCKHLLTQLILSRR